MVLPVYAVPHCSCLNFNGIAPKYSGICLVVYSDIPFGIKHKFGRCISSFGLAQLYIVVKVKSCFRIVLYMYMHYSEETGIYPELIHLQERSI